MEERYHQIGLEERCRIAQLRTQGCSIRQIAAALDRQPSSIARELRRNSGQRGDYQPGYAHRQSRARRWTGSKLDRDPELRRTVLVALACGRSPEQVAGRLAKDEGHGVVSYETIYRFLYAQIVRTKDCSWRHLLPRGKWQRGRRWSGKRSSASFIARRRPISERPLSALDRQTPGHWEADLMLFTSTGQALLAVHERHTRLLLAVRLSGKAAEPVAHAMVELLKTLPEPWRQSVTCDNGIEFARHYHLHAHHIQTFFCDPYAPWQKGGIENAIGRLRRTLPRKTDLATISEAHFRALIQQYNNTPRKCLDFRTPAELFWEKLLHFKCESSFLLPQE
jgi:IS30 family transposase